MNQKVLVRDFRPHCSTKWYQTTVLKRLGSLTYEVMMEGKPRCVHVDHLRPLVDEQEESNNVTDDQATINVTELNKYQSFHQRTLKQLLSRTQDALNESRSLQKD